MTFKGIAGNRYSVNTYYVVGERIFRLALETVIWVIVARYLGPEGIGIISFAQSLVILLLPMANLGLDNFVVMRCVSHPGESGSTIFTAFFLKLSASILLFSVFASIVIVYGSHMQFNKVVVILISTSVLFQAFNVVELYFQAEVKSLNVVYVKMVQLICSVFFKAILIISESPVEYFAVALMLDGLLMAVGLSYIFLSKMKNLELTYSRYKARDLLRRSWPLIATGFAIAIYMKIDIVMLKYLAGDQEVGIYSVASRLSEALYFLPVVIVSSLYPGILRAKDLDRQLYMLRLSQLFSFMAFLSILFSITILFFGENLIHQLFSESFFSATPILQLHVWASLSVFIGIVRGRWMSDAGYQKLELYLNILGGLINILLNLILIPVWGGMGAALATLISYFSVTILIPLFFQELREITFLMARSFFIFPRVLIMAIRTNK